MDLGKILETNKELFGSFGKVLFGAGLGFLAADFPETTSVVIGAGFLASSLMGLKKGFWYERNYNNDYNDGRGFIDGFLWHGVLPFIAGACTYYLNC